MKYISILSILFVTFISGCSGSAISTISLENSNHHVVIGNTVLANKLQFSHSKTQRNDGYLHASVEVMNKTDATISLSYRFYWYDAKGLEINHLPSTFSTLTMTRNQVSLLQALAPSIMATQYRIAVRDTNN
ncbi:YcfL family protein [Photobacterium piscicola]|uniref:YcfL family protein n=1 Tax=Photobacterium piscicola TaxID=1378299 RepID=A0ABU6LCS9_9GAMM|nr:YcfL family protein [Photobacterium piscicola]MEC6897373.1 YcfL family protein [Photobacterium piscicola]